MRVNLVLVQVVETKEAEFQEVKLQVVGAHDVAPQETELQKMGLTQHFYK